MRGGGFVGGLPPPPVYCGGARVGGKSREARGKGLGARCEVSGVGARYQGARGQGQGVKGQGVRGKVVGGKGSGGQGKVLGGKGSGARVRGKVLGGKGSEARGLRCQVRDKR